MLSCEALSVPKGRFAYLCLNGRLGTVVLCFMLSFAPTDPYHTPAECLVLTVSQPRTQAQTGRRSVLFLLQGMWHAAVLDGAIAIVFIAVGIKIKWLLVAIF